MRGAGRARAGCGCGCTGGSLPREACVGRAAAARGRGCGLGQGVGIRVISRRLLRWPGWPPRPGRPGPKPELPAGLPVPSSPCGPPRAGLPVRASPCGPPRCAGLCCLPSPFAGAGGTRSRRDLNQRPHGSAGIRAPTHTCAFYFVLVGGECDTPGRIPTDNGSGCSAPLSSPGHTPHSTTTGAAPHCPAED